MPSFDTSGTPPITFDCLIGFGVFTRFANLNVAVFGRLF